MKGYQPQQVNKQSTIQTQSKTKPTFLELGEIDSSEGGEKEIEQRKQKRDIKFKDKNN
jgi:hypothetical protein